MTMKPSTKKAAGAAAVVLALATPLTMYWEGKRNKTYIDIAGIPTACYGQTGDKVKVGATYSDETCEKWLREELQAYYEAVDRCIPEMAPHQAAAFTVFAYNVGIGGACGSSAARYARDKQWPQACAALERWNKYRNPKTGQLEVSQGLANRRAAERRLCEGKPHA